MYNIITVKHGTKYNADYVNRMYNMISRNVTLPHKFYCFTEDPTDLDPGIKVMPLPTDIAITGWWFKTYIFKKGLFEPGTTNFFTDLDMVILSNIDDMLTYRPGKFVGMRNLHRVLRPNVRDLGSCLMRWPADQFYTMWEDIRKNPRRIDKYNGDQEYIFEKFGSFIEFWPDEWTISYRWRTANEDDAKFLCFHNEPRPHEVMTKDLRLIEHWR